jgi:hypothetical protein
LVSRETPLDRNTAGSVDIPQYTFLRILAVWAAAALPMAALAWLVAPALEDEFGVRETCRWRRRCSSCSPPV